MNSWWYILEDGKEDNPGNWLKRNNVSTGVQKNTLPVLKGESVRHHAGNWVGEDFKKTESAEKIASKARMIYSEFIEADAPKEVSEIFHNSEYLSTYPLTHLLPIEGH